jgi:phage gp46-like protein
MSDITTVWDATNAVGDWALDGPILQAGDDLATAILISLCTDRSASPDDTLPDGTTDRRGWWGDAGEDYQIGSRLWLLSRAKQTDDTLQKAFDYVQEALQWMIDDKAVGEFEITVQWVKTSTLGITVTAIKDGERLASVGYASLWNTP